MIKVNHPGGQATLDNLNLEEVTLNDIINGLGAENRISTNGMTYFMLAPVTNQPVDKNVPLAKLGVKEGDTIELTGKGVAA